MGREGPAQETAASRTTTPRQGRRGMITSSLKNLKNLEHPEHLEHPENLENPD
jgi:hypothetical protein